MKMFEIDQKKILRKSASVLLLNDKYERSFILESLEKIAIALEMSDFDCDGFLLQIEKKRNAAQDRKNIESYDIDFSGLDGPGLLI